MSYEKKSNQIKDSKNDIIFPREIHCVSCTEKVEQSKKEYHKFGGYCKECDVKAEQRSMLRAKIGNIKNAISGSTSLSVSYVTSVFVDRYGREPRSESEFLSFAEEHLEIYEKLLKDNIDSCQYYLRDEELYKLKYLFQSFDEVPNGNTERFIV